MNDIRKLKKFLQKKYPNIQAFNTRNITGDFLLKVYDRDGIIVDYAPNYDYIEIFGLTNDEFNELTENGHLKTFVFKERKKRKNENEN